MEEGEIEEEETKKKVPLSLEELLAKKKAEEAALAKVGVKCLFVFSTGRVVCLNNVLLYPQHTVRGYVVFVALFIHPFVCLCVTLFINFLCLATKSGGVLCYTLRTFECLSIRPSVRPSVSG